MKLYHWTLKANPKSQGSFTEDQYALIKGKGWAGKYDIREEVIVSHGTHFAPPKEVVKATEKKKDA